MPAIPAWQAEAVAACAEAVARARADLLVACRPRIREAPLDWWRANLHLHLIHPDAPLEFIPDPYQVEPLLAQFRPGVRKLTCMAVEQTGKTLIWVAGLLYRLACAPVASWIVYPSDTEAAEKNEEMVEPLIRGIPRLAAELARPNAKRMGAPARYRFRDSITYFSGAGAALISKTITLGICDETDQWDQAVGKERRITDQDNVSNMDKRLRTIRNALRIATSSPTTAAGRIAREYGKSSKGKWHLCCLGCGRLHPSSDLLPLHWHKDDDNELLPGTLRWVCPGCQREHVENEAPAMNAAGKYVHERPELLDSHPGYQWGALACPRAPGLNWEYIARKIIEAGRYHTLEAEAEVDNSIRGLPYIPRQVQTEHHAAVKAHCAPAPDPAKLAIVLWAADTQDDGWYWTATGMDQQENLYVLAYGRVRTEKQLAAAWAGRYAGILPALGVVDEGGHLAKIVQAFVSTRPGCYSYKGATQAVPLTAAERFKLDPANQRILARPKHYQSELLHRLHFQPAGGTHGGLYLPEYALPETLPATAGAEPGALYLTASDEFISHLAAVRRVKTARVADADSLDNWAAEGRPDHWFDCLKMTLTAADVAIRALPQQFWRLPKPGAKIRRASVQSSVPLDL